MAKNSNVSVVDFKHPRDAQGNIILHASVKELAKKIEQDAYDKALAQVLARAEKLNW
jgi:hypothetical protein|uniref:Uncharacterized protein n=1 Tax=Myoviridae sp. ctshb19 TaxID=2825194 RepID=A0A8S5UGA4_9CAUD|nr:MAG TPA: hypothetical protein [Myoviridae sp. ctshb19]